MKASKRSYYNITAILLCRQRYGKEEERHVWDFDIAYEKEAPLGNMGYI
jgi:hypothetical protein